MARRIFSPASSQPAHLDQQLAQVEQRFGVAGVLTQAGEVMLPRLLELALAPERLGDAHVDLGVRILRSSVFCQQ